MAAEQPPSRIYVQKLQALDLKISIVLDCNYLGKFTVKLANVDSFEIPQVSPSAQSIEKRLHN